MMMKAIIDVYKREQEHIEDELDIQIISPMRRGEAGSTLISQYVQQAVNPPDSLKGEARVNGITYRVGDKVIQILNDYELEVFNGEIGIIYAITRTDICIRFIHKEVTRAKRKVIIVGTTSAIERAVRTVNGDERYTLFKERLQGRCDS